MLNGIGGRTIAEAQKAIGYREYLTWIAFRKRRGTLHSGMRMDNGFALLATVHANTHSKDKKFTVRDFSPYLDEPEIDMQTAMETWV